MAKIEITIKKAQYCPVTGRFIGWNVTLETTVEGKLNDAKAVVYAHTGISAEVRWERVGSTHRLSSLTTRTGTWHVEVRAPSRRAI